MFGRHHIQQGRGRLQVVQGLAGLRNLDPIDAALFAYLAHLPVERAGVVGQFEAERELVAVRVDQTGAQGLDAVFASSACEIVGAKARPNIANIAIQVKALSR